MPVQSDSIETTRRRLVAELETILGCKLEAGDHGRPLHELGVDSMSLVELLVVIEREFGVRLVESGVTSEDLRTVEGLASAIHRA